MRALHNVLRVRAGEVAALLGENGAGKSTLMNVLGGVFSSYGGEIEVGARPVSIHSPRDAQQLGIAMIHQELNLVPDLSIADNIFLGRERRTSWRTLSRAAMNARATELLAGLGLRLNPERQVRRLRIAEQQLVEVAKALSLNVRILVMDEPTSALADAEVHRLFSVIRDLTARSVAVIYISHRLEEIDDIADNVTVLRDGEWVGTRRIGETSRDELVRMMVGRPLRELYPREDHQAGADRLRVEGLSLDGDPSGGRAGLRGVSLSARAGEIVGVAGLMGAGRSETLETIFGAYPRRYWRGSMRLDGRPYTPRSPRAAIGRGVALVAEDRKLKSLVLQNTVRFNVSLAAAAAAPLADHRPAPGTLLGGDALRPPQSHATGAVWLLP